MAQDTNHATDGVGVTINFNETPYMASMVGFHRNGSWGQMPALIMARSQAEAEAKSIILAAQEYPESEGWNLREVAVSNLIEKGFEQGVFS